MHLHKARALITGGASGLGRKLSDALLQRGAKVVIADINADEGKKAETQSLDQYGDDRLKFIQCDVTDKQQLHETFEAAHKCFGGLDIVCNNAGIIGDTYSIARTQVDINLTAVIEGTFRAIEPMSKQTVGGGGVVVNVASAAGIDLLKVAPVYTATKQGVVAFTRCFSALPHFVEDGVRVNCLCPFFFKSNLTEKSVEEHPQFGQLIHFLGGYVDVEHVVDGFLKVLQDDEMNAKAVVVQPPDKIYTMKFPPAKL